MSFDLALWRKGRRGITPGLSYLLLANGLEVEELPPLDVDDFLDKLERALPGWQDEDSPDWMDCSATPCGVLLSLSWSYPEKSLDALLALARREHLEVFDPQQDEVTAADRAQCEKRLWAIRKAEEAHRWQGDFAELERRASAGEPKALYLLGNRYSFGDGVPQDFAKAIVYFRRAAELGSAEAMFNLGGCYRRGEGVKRDGARAVRWYERARAAGEFFAPFALGEMHATGDGVGRDRDQAVAYFEEALRLGHQDAPRWLRQLGARPPLSEDGGS